VEGPAELLANLPTVQRRLATIAMFLFAGAVILVNAEPFCEGLVATGKSFGINEFVLVQWLAPLASEAPEFTVALVFAWRGQAGLALGSLLSSKLNQWTLLVGMIPGAYALSSGTLAHPMPLSGVQLSEIMLTAAQSLLGVLLLAGLRLTPRAAALLFGLFSGQLVLPVLINWMPGLAFGFSPQQIHPLFAALYLGAAVVLWAERPNRVAGLLRGFRAVPELPAPQPEGCTEEFKTPHCATCRFRLAMQARQAATAS
jgi:cation:H+ antiporter